MRPEGIWSVPRALQQHGSPLNSIGAFRPPASRCQEHQVTVSYDGLSRRFCARLSTQRSPASTTFREKALSFLRPTTSPTLTQSWSSRPLDGRFATWPRTGTSETQPCEHSCGPQVKSKQNETKVVNRHCQTLQMCWKQMQPWEFSLKAHAQSALKPPSCSPAKRVLLDLRHPTHTPLWSRLPCKAHAMSWSRNGTSGLACTEGSR